MTPARIAALLQPFLVAPASLANSSSSCHSEPGRRRGEEPSSYFRHDEDEDVRAAGHSAKQRNASAVTLTAAQLHHISIYIDLLVRWNARMNLTAIRDPQDIVTRHFGESLFAARCLFPVIDPTSPDAAPSTLADIGSGAGFPGLPIKLWAPHIALTLIESNHKKATFLREVTRALTLTDVNIQITRVEALAGTQPAAPRFDVVTMRAVERFESILPLAAALVAPAGRLALLIGSSQLSDAQRHAATPSSNFYWLEPASVPLSKSKILAVAFRKQ